MRHAQLGSRRTSRRAKSSGFTLVELMTVVAITGILAAIGVMMVKGHVLAAKSSLALAGIQAIRVAEESARSEAGQYLSCSAADSTKWYPMDTPGKVKYDWRKPDHADWLCWQSLGVTRTAPTQYGYLVNAGPPGGTYPNLHTAEDLPFPSPAPDPWYVIQVKGDVDGDGEFMQGVASSYSGEVYFERESE